jgi:hypothetical protein
MVKIDCKGDDRDDLIRFVTDVRHPPYGHRSGIFSIAYELLREQRCSPDTADELNRLLAWFRENLSIPTKFTTSKYPRAKETAISWIRASARDHLVSLRRLSAVLDEIGIRTEELHTRRPGYVVYEDAYQVVAQPFSDTPS